MKINSHVRILDQTFANAFGDLVFLYIHLFKKDNVNTIDTSVHLFIESENNDDAGADVGYSLKKL